jgi:hypothetical protein
VLHVGLEQLRRAFEVAALARLLERRDCEADEDRGHRKRDGGFDERDAAAGVTAAGVAGSGAGVHRGLLRRQRMAAL